MPCRQWACRTKRSVTHLPAQQGLDKLENRSLYPEQYANWQNNPAEFTIALTGNFSRADVGLAGAAQGPWSGRWGAVSD